MGGKIINKCEVSDFKPLSELSTFATDIKKRTGYDIGRLKKSIVTNGFLFPLFIWNEGNLILDGKARYLALLELESEGYEVGDIPVVYVSAKDEKEAKEKLLQVNSRYGKITEGSLNFFAKDCDINLSDLNIHLDKINFEFKKKDDVVKKAASLVFGENSAVEPLRPSVSPSIAPSISIESSFQQVEPTSGVNDGSIEQTWVEEHQSEAESNLDPLSGGFEVETEQFSQSFEPTEQTETSFKPTQEQVAREEKTVSFMCPFCYGEFTLTMDEVKELLEQ